MNSLLADPATYADGVPHDHLARLREQAPLAWVDEPDLVRHSSAGRTVHRGSGYWIALTHAAVVEASRRPESFSSSARGAFLVDPRTRSDLVQARQLLVNMDAPQHSKVRRLVTSVFTPRAVARLVDGVHRHARRLADTLHERGEADAVADFAAELPLLVLADLLGLPPEDRHLLFKWSNYLVGFDDPEYGGGDVEAYRRTMFEAFQYAMAMRTERQRRPTDDLGSLLATAQVDGERLTDREYCNFWLLLVVAGNETTRHLLANTLLLMSGHPAERRRLIADPALMPSAVDELLRMITPIMQFRRTATHETTLAGVRVQAGQKVVLSYAAANRDPAVFADADRLDLGRDPNPHLAFGIGPHFCLGSHLARLETTAALAALGPRLDGLALTAPPVRLESNFVNGLKSLPIRCGQP
ncbi:cytochrome P450 [Plantactinospora sp. WMMC1484]|uniref:cytochrome P450 n=1 Tax=Plantactinospora sp. WMMC1484 TaxID=3404122 RepID=UPI003BF554DB